MAPGPYPGGAVFLGCESPCVLGGVRLSLGAWKVRKGVVCVCMSVTGTVVCFVYVGLSVTG